MRLRLQIFVEFLERSCTAEFSGFLLYKELGRRLKKTNPVVAEVRAACHGSRSPDGGMLVHNFLGSYQTAFVGWCAICAQLYVVACTRRGSA